MELPQLNLPSLSNRYDAALRAAMAYIFANFEPFAVIVTGSIVRGNPDPGSDFDILVLHEQSWRRRVQRFFGGVPAEIFINSPKWMEIYMVQEEAEERPIMANMLTTGVVVFSSSSMTDKIIETARASLAKGANFSEFALRQKRYSTACLFEDAIEVFQRDEATAALILGRAIDAGVAYWFASRQRFSVRPKDQLDVIRRETPEIGEIIEQALLGAVSKVRIEAARELARAVLGEVGFFEWDSGPSEMS